MPPRKVQTALRTSRPVLRRRRWIRRLLLGLPVGLVCVLAWLWFSRVQVTRIEIKGAHHADADQLRALAAVDSGAVLFELDPEVIADRVKRHPWVREASVTRFPTGVLLIHVEERVPVVLQMEATGRPARYLDAEGYAMPLGKGTAADVPLLHGVRGPVHPMRPVQDERVRALLSALAAMPEAERALISEILYTPEHEFWLYTTPAAGQGSIPVRLGREGFAERLRILAAFWQQAVLTQPNKTFSLIDLRFAGQVIVQERLNL
jgi:cell division protein FtsQ